MLGKHKIRILNIWLSRFFCGSFVIGDDCSLGANATIIGPLILGERIKVGASACVIKVVGLMKVY